MMTKYSRQRNIVIDSEVPLFCSLVDYRNNYFTSNDPDKIIEFYNSFENRDQLIQWMKERPKGIANIHEVDGDKDVIVVITTADFDGKYAKECRENIFKGLHMVFVESGEISNSYFNYAHNMNVGISRAMEYNPRWIVISNDDMYKIDDVSILKSQLEKIDPDKFYMVLSGETHYHTVKSRFSSPRFIRSYFSLINFIRNHRKEGRFWKIISMKSSQKNLEKKFSCFYVPNDPKGLSKYIYKKGFNYRCFMDFGIFSASYVKSLSYKLFDESFINAYEDHDISLKFYLQHLNYAVINYRIGDYIGSSLGTGIPRELRNIASLSYLNYKFEK